MSTKVVSSKRVVQGEIRYRRFQEIITYKDLTNKLIEAYLKGRSDEKTSSRRKAEDVAKTTSSTLFDAIKQSMTFAGNQGIALKYTFLKLEGLYKNSANFKVFIIVDEDDYFSGKVDELYGWAFDNSEAFVKPGIKVEFSFFGHVDSLVVEEIEGNDYMLIHKYE